MGKAAPTLNGMHPTASASHPAHDAIGYERPGSRPHGALGGTAWAGAHPSSSTSRRHRSDITYTCSSPECDHGRLKARLRPKRGLKTDRTASIVISGHALVQNIRRGHYQFDCDTDPTTQLEAAFVALRFTLKHRRRQRPIVAAAPRSASTQQNRRSPLCGRVPLPRLRGATTRAASSCSRRHTRSR